MIRLIGCRLDYIKAGRTRTTPRRGSSTVAWMDEVSTEAGARGSKAQRIGHLRAGEQVDGSESAWRWLRSFTPSRTDWPWSFPGHQRRRNHASKLKRPGPLTNRSRRPPIIETFLKNWICCARRAASASSQ